MRKLVYVSGPLTHHKDGPWIGVSEALDAGNRLLDLGYAPVVPHLSFYWEQEHTTTRTYEDFMAIDLALVGRMDALLRLPGGSLGSDREVARAKYVGVPVFTSIEDLIHVLSNGAGESDAREQIPSDSREWVPSDSDVATRLHDELSSLATPPVTMDTELECNKSSIDRALTKIAAIFNAKNADYRDESEPWDSNFRDVARQMGWDDASESAEVLIAVKQARLRALRVNDRPPTNEAVADTILDRAVYAVIALAMLIEKETA